MVKTAFALFAAFVALASAQLSVPDVPASADLSVVSGSALQLDFEAPLTDGGAAVQEYLVEWDTDPGEQEIQTITTKTYIGANEVQLITTSATDRNEVQVIRTFAPTVLEVQTLKTSAFSGNSLSGTYSLAFNTTATGGTLQYSGEISYNAEAQGGRYSVKSILEAMSNIGPGGIHNVTRSSPDDEGGYTWSVTFASKMGNVTALELYESALKPVDGAPAVEVQTVKDGNEIYGGYRLEFDGYTTEVIPYDASDSEVEAALEALSTVTTVDVTRSGPDNQRGYKWSVTFTHDDNAGNVNPLVPVYDSMAKGSGRLLYGTSGDPTVSVTSTDGNEISGEFRLGFACSTCGASYTYTKDIPYDASAAVMKDRLEALNTIPEGAISVERSGPDFELGYVWTISFLEDYNRTFEGDVNEFLPAGKLNGTNAAVTVTEARKGTKKTVQTIDVKLMNSNLFQKQEVDNATFALTFDGQTTGQIPLTASNSSGKWSCDGTVHEMQTLTISTTDTTASGGDSTVSQTLYFRLSWGGYTTNKIQANPNDGSCLEVQQDIKTELMLFPNIFSMDVTSYKLDTFSQGCTWNVTFTSTSGNIDQMTVKGINGAEASGPSSEVYVGDDALKICADGTGCVDGSKDIIKTELEKLDNIGTVTVKALEPTSHKECAWRVTFDTNAGKLPNMTATTATQNVRVSICPGGSSAENSMATDIYCQEGTSTALGGDFAIEFRGQRTGYLDYQSSSLTVKSALESLSTVGTVDVVRAGPDENSGYTWSVTFLTELGDVEALIVDDLDLLGTVATGEVSEFLPGITPPFDSLDPANGLPLGSTTLTNVDDLSFTVLGLEQGIPYYFRVSAINAQGQGPARISNPPYKLPLSQPSDAPTEVSLSPVDGSTLHVSMRSPARDGGEEIDKYRVEYSTQAFDDEVQAVRVICDARAEIQTITTNTSTKYEVQLVHAKMNDSYVPMTNRSEVQEVRCDASGGTFSIEFNGLTTSEIAWDASAKDVETAMEELTVINNVKVEMDKTQACSQSGPSGFNVTYLSVVGIRGEMPLMTVNTNLLTGHRRVEAKQAIQGQAPLGGSFRLTFRGDTTADIGATATAAEVQTALMNLDTIQTDGVVVSEDRFSACGTPYTDAKYECKEKMWAVTFVGSGVGGNVEDMTIATNDDELTGNGAEIHIYVDGSESLSDRRGIFDGSIQGNELSDTFTLQLRGHTTEPIEFNAADSTMKTRLEALPNIGTVDVKRSAASPTLGYTWTVTFVSNPGYFPVMSRNVDLLLPDITYLGGNESKVTVQTIVEGSDPLGGFFQLSFRDTNGYINQTAELEKDVSAGDMKAELEQLDSIGRVEVSRQTNVDGYTWLVTFNGCRTVGIYDVCNTGDLKPMTTYNNLTGGNISDPTVTVTEVVAGSGPSVCEDREDLGLGKGLCYDYVTDLSGGAPYTYDITGLTTATPYYVRVAAHTATSFGHTAISTPEYEMPANNQPGKMTPVRLVSSTTTSITLEWDFPTINGGADVNGFELWMDDWAGGNPRLVFDGTDQPTRTSYQVDTGSSLGVESGRQYRFQARAINYCSPTDTKLACYGEFSDVSVFTVRAPRPPIPPNTPLRDESTSVGTVNPRDADITIYWHAPDDNGGSPITSYEVWWAHTGTGNFRKWTGSPVYSNIDELATGVSGAVVDGTHTMELTLEATITGLHEGELYKFYVVAVNDKGKSGRSPILSTIAGTTPGRDAALNHTYASVKPTITDVEETSISLSWPSPVVNSTGSSPITGYKVYMFPGVALNSVADPNPVKMEVQTITTYVNEPHSEHRRLTLENAGGHFQIHMTLPDTDGTGSERYMSDNLKFAVTGDISATADAATVKAELEKALANAGYADQTVDVGKTPSTSSSTSGSVTILNYNVSFTSFDGEIPNVAIMDSSLSRVDRDYPVTSTVRRLTTGTSALVGTFTLSFRGAETIPLKYDISADGMKGALENLDTIQVVTVTRNASDVYGAYVWSVTFDSEPGDVEAIVPTAGRLIGGESPGITVATPQPGSDAVLVYDGTDIPEIKYFTATGLTPDALYSFKVTPINAIGDGILSGAAVTVAARAGASPAQTTATGGSLVTGISGVVYEQQVVTAAFSSPYLYLKYPTGNLATDHWSVNTVNATADEMESALNASYMGIGKVHVTRAERSTNGISAYAWTVTFLEKMGDIPLLEASNMTRKNPNALNDSSVVEFLKGHANEFIVEPKKGSGAPVKDITAASGFAGQDVFFTELWAPESATIIDGTHDWIMDGYQATYNPVVYDVQQITIDGDASFYAFNLTMDMTNRTAGSRYTTSPIPIAASPYDVKIALEALENIEAVDVNKTTSNGDTIFMVTFTHDLGYVPNLIASNPDSIAVSKLDIGVTEIQTITVSSDEYFIYEEQTVTVNASGSADAGNFTLYLGDEDDYTLPMSIRCADRYTTAGQLKCAQNVETALEATLSITDVEVSLFVGPGTGTGDVYTVKFLDPVGDVPDLVANVSTVGDVQVDEVLKGYSPLDGTFTVAYEGEYSMDVDFDASAAEMKVALEAINTIDEVDVQRENLGSGFRWTVTFTKALGNLRNMVSMMYKFEEQTIRTLGGDPTPLGGSFTLTYGGAETKDLPYDITADGMKAALEELPTIERVDVGRDIYDYGQYAWRVTFRSELGDVPMIDFDKTLLTGSDANIAITEVQVGDAMSLTGSNQFVSVREKVAGLPSYTGMYVPDDVGSYALAVRQLQKGGLHADYFDNQWLLDSPVIERIDPTINFDWGTGVLTTYGRDYVSARWTGKVLPDSTEEYTLYTYADDGVRLYIDHELVIDSWDECCTELKTKVNFTAGTYHDIKVEYKEETGPASISLKWSSYSVKKQIIPSSAFYYATNIAGSPFPITVLPGAADYPFTDAMGAGLTDAVAGNDAYFTIQAKDAQGNNKITKSERDDASNVFTVDVVGPTEQAADVTYIGDGKYAVQYTVLKAGYYDVFVKTAGTDIYCGLGEEGKCSPFNLTVEPGATVAQTSEAESRITRGISVTGMDSLVEAAAGDTASFSIQAKDTYGNNRWMGGDAFEVMMTHHVYTEISYRGTTLDLGNGSYVVTYTVPTAGSYDMSVTFGNEPILTCTDAYTFTRHDWDTKDNNGDRYMGLLFERDYNGVDAYVTPNFCTHDVPTLLVVHGPLHPPSTTAVDVTTTKLSGKTEVEIAGLSQGVTGITQYFTVESRDNFGNLRHGDDTPNFPGGYGDGASDYFLVSLSGPDGYEVISSSAVHVIKSRYTKSDQDSGYFRLRFAGGETEDLPYNISASGLETALEAVHADPHRVKVARTGTNATWSHKSISHDYEWSVTFLSHLDELYPTIAHPGLEKVQASVSSDDLYDYINITKTASGGLYPVDYTLWYKGSYELSITSANEHIFGSPFPVQVLDGAVYAESSTATGAGLVGGVAGDQFEFTVQAMDVRTTEQQSIRTDAYVVDVVHEVQEVTCTGTGAFKLMFQGTSYDMICDTTTATQLEDTLRTFPTVVANTIGSNAIDVTKSTVSGSTVYSVTFKGYMGDVPPMTSTASTVSVSEIIKGDTPFRKTVQTFKCEKTDAWSTVDGAANGWMIVSIPGRLGGKSVRIEANATIAEFEAKVDQLTNVNVSMYSNHTNGAIEKDDSRSICTAGLNAYVYITFVDAIGNVDLDIETHWLYNANLEKFASPSDGVVEGIHPVWGTFTLTFDGETTADIPVDATAGEMENFLEALDNIGDVTVWKDVIGTSLGATVDSEGHVISEYDMHSGSTSLFSVWTIDFDGLCTLEKNAGQSGSPDSINAGGYSNLNAGNGGWSNCPNNVGDLPLFEVDYSGLFFEESPYQHQYVPTVEALEIRPGTMGNTRDDGDDIDDVAVLMTHELDGYDSQPFMIGMYEQQAIHCVINNDTNVGEAYFVLTFFNQETKIYANTTMQDLKAAISGIHDASRGWNVTAGSKSRHNSQSTVCQSQAPGHYSDPVYVTFAEKGTLPSFVVKEAVGVDVSVTEIVRGIDSIEYLGGETGQYKVVYSPPMKGNYTIKVTINDVEIESDLSSGLYVLPAEVSSSQTPHDARLVATEDVMEPFTIQATDRFGNELDGPIGESAFIVSLNGSAHSYSGHPAGTKSFLDGKVVDFSPNTDGIYYTTYFPELAGPHILSTQLRSQGGLLATYFINPDFTDEVLGNDDHLKFPYHDPEWCPPTLLNCDSTRLDPTIDFYWATAAPLNFTVTSAQLRGPTSDDYSAFPEDFFSVRWEGEIMAPVTETFTFTFAVDNHVKLTIGGVVVVQDDDVSTSEVSGTFDMVAGELYPIEVTYKEELDEAHIHMYWESPSLPREVVPSSALYYTRHVGNSPVEVMIYPGDVDSDTTTASGTGLTKCTTMEECYFTIQAKDTHGNHIFNQGLDDWVLEMTGIDDWAGLGRTNDRADVSGKFFDNQNHSEHHYYPEFEPIDWEFLGYATVIHGHTYAYDTSADFIRMGLLERGDVLILGDELFKVDMTDPNFNNKTVPLDSAYRGGMEPEARLRYRDDERYDCDRRDVDCTYNFGWQRMGSERVPAYRAFAGGKTGTYKVNYTPYVRGDYRLDVMVPGIAEVQRVTTGVAAGGDTLAGNGDGNSTFTLSVTALSPGNGNGHYNYGNGPAATELVTRESRPIPYDASTHDVYEKLMALDNIWDVNVNRTDCEQPELTCTWYITFRANRYADRDPKHLTDVHGYGADIFNSNSKPGIGMDSTGRRQSSKDRYTTGVSTELNDGDIAIMTADLTSLAGNFPSVDVTEEVKGVPAKQIMSAPWVTVIDPNITDAPYTTAYGRGLVAGTAGDTASFTIQSKDAWGNNRRDSQEQDLYRVWAYPNNEAPEVATGVPGNVTYIGDGQYQVDYVPTTYGKHTVAVMKAENQEVQVLNATVPSRTKARGTYTLFIGDCEGQRNDIAQTGASNRHELNQCQETMPLAWDTSAEDVAAALEALPGVGSISAARYGMSTSSIQADGTYRNPNDPFANSYIYSITFSTYVGDVPTIGVNTTLFERLCGGSVAVSTAVPGTMRHIKAAEDWNDFGVPDAPLTIYDGPWVNEKLINEIQVVRIWGNAKSGDQFQLSFNGHATILMNATCTAMEMKLALEDLEGIGSVNVERYDHSGSSGKQNGNGFEWQVEFRPNDGSTFAHMTNYGNLPALVPIFNVTYATGGFNMKVLTGGYDNPRSEGRFNYTDGVSPFEADIKYAALSSAHSTAVHQPHVAGFNGLETGIFQHQTSFTIEARDRFSNRVEEGPLMERQIIESWSDNTIGGTFTVGFQGSTVDIPYNAGIMDMEAALESLPGLGAVTVTTNSAKDIVSGCTVKVVHGSEFVEPSCGATILDIFEVGDWIRIYDNSSGPVFTVLEMSKATGKWVLTLSSPYMYDMYGREYLEDGGVPFFEQGQNGKGKRLGYQYIVDFDSNLGDLPALYVDGAGLTADNTTSLNASVAVLNCDWYKMQTITTSALDQISGSFYISFKGDRTLDLRWDIGMEQMKQAVESLDSVITATVMEMEGPGLNGGYRWTIRLDSIMGAYEPMYTEGHLLEGNKAHVTVKNHCPYTVGNNSEMVLWNLNSLKNQFRGGVGSTVRSTAGRLGKEFVARLSGADAVAANVSHIDQGLYYVSYEAPRVDAYDLDIAGAAVGGLYAEYFNNRWLYGEATMSRIDPIIDFSWSADDIITPTGKDYISARWTGFVQPTFGEDFTFYVIANDGARLFVGGELLFDAFDNEVADGDAPAVYKGTVSMVKNLLTDIKLEWRENTGAAFVRLMWSSASQPQTVVPSNRLFSSSTPIVDSPFQVAPTAIISTPPTDVSIEIEDWDKIKVQWYAPENDGGEGINSFLVEWWNAEEGVYGTNEVQTILVSGAVDGGTWLLTSPSGYQYPFPLPWDIEYDELEAVLESLDDVGDVSVTIVDSTDKTVRPKNAIDRKTREYRITFLSNIGNVAPLAIDMSGLTASNGTRAMLVCHQYGGVHTDALGVTDLTCESDLKPNATIHGNATLASGGRSEEASLDVAEGDAYSYTIKFVDQDSAIPDGFGVRVSVKNPSRGYSIPAETLYLKPMAVPDPPQLVEIVRVAGSSTAFNVYWSYTYYPRDRAAKVNEYLIEWNAAADFSSDVGGSYQGINAMFPCYRQDHYVYGEYLQHTIEGLAAGTAYYVRVSAVNKMGTGAPQVSSPTSLLASKTVDQLEYGTGVTLATIPADESVTVGESSTSLLVSFQASEDIHGAEAEEYLLEYWRTLGRNEVQVIAIDGQDKKNLTGTFKIAYDGATTDTLNFDISEVGMEAALEELTTIRDVKVVRTTNTTVGTLGMPQYSWTVTFLSEAPYTHGKYMTIDGSDLKSNGLSSAVTAKVGYDLTANLPGFKFERDTTLTYGSDKIQPSSTDSIDVYDFVRISTGEVFQIVKIDSAGYAYLDDKYYGSCTSNCPCDYGVTAPGLRQLGLTNVTIPAGAGAPYSYVLTELDPGQRYYVRVSAKNARGYNQPQVSMPTSILAPRQKPDVPINVQLVVNSGTSLKLLWHHPDSDGGDMVTKYKIEWDTMESFDSTNGSPLGSHHKILTNPSDDCKVASCSYVVHSLTKGTPYYVRIYAYNSFGYSVTAGMSPSKLESPKRQADPPAVVNVAAASQSSLLVTFPASADNGGGEITKYKVEWDSVGQAGAEAGVALYNESLLYSDYSVQTIETKSSTASIYGYFQLALDDHITETLAYDISAGDLEAKLEALPPVGDVTVTRSEKAKAADGSYGYVWSVTFLTLSGQHDFFGDTSVLTVGVTDSAYAKDFTASSSITADTSGVIKPGDGKQTLKCIDCGSGSSITVTETVERYDGYAQQIISTTTTIANSTLGGSFKIRRNGESTPALSPDIDAAGMETALSALSGVGKVFVTRKDVGTWVKDAYVKHSWVVVFLEQLGNQVSLISDDRLLTCSDLSAEWGVQVSDEYQVGFRPLLDSGNKGEMVLAGDAIAGDTISYEIPDLVRGEAYHVRVSAWNGVGYSYGLTQFSTPAVQYPAAAPDSPAYVLALPASSNKLNVSFAPPLSDNGLPITKYKVEWDGAPGVSEVQLITTSASASLAGTFRLSFRGQSTAALPYDASVERLQVALEALQTVGKVQVERTGPVSNGFMWEVTFLQNVGDLPLVSVDPSGLIGSNVATDVSELIKGTSPSFDQGTVGIHEMPLGSMELTIPDEVQEIALSAQAEDVDGYFYVTFMGETTEKIYHNFTAEEMEASLLGLSTVTAISVTKRFTYQSTVAPLSDYGWVWSVTFTAQSGDLPSMLVYTGQKTRTSAAGGSLLGTGTKVTVTEAVKGVLSTYFVTEATLTPGATYFARVSAYNSEGWSAPSLAALSTTTENQLPSAPLDVGVSVYTDTSLEVSWMPPAHTGGDPISRYLVQWDQDETFDDSTGTAIEEAVEGKSLYTYRITGLSPGAENVVRVMAYNNQGYGEPTLAVPLGAFEEIQQLEISNGTTASALRGSFNLDVNTTATRSQTTGAIEAGASAWKLQDRLQALDNVGTVVVTRHDHSNLSPEGGGRAAYDASGVKTKETKFIYRITFIAPLNEDDVHVLQYHNARQA